MKYLSVCSGIEAATVAWHHLGWTPTAFAEVEPFPSAVLAHHYPTVVNRGDMTKFQEWPDEAVDHLVGGTPCQSFSVAGLRQGLKDPRGNLMLTYLGIADRLRPKWLVWENVPGVLSSNAGRDFGTFLGSLVELGYGFAYRVLDAQWFGVAQRRRRVFVVGYLGDASRAAKVLFESESVCRNPAPSREKGKGVAINVADCLRSGEQLATTRMVAFGEYVNDGTASTLKSRDYKDATDLVATAFESNRRDGARVYGDTTNTLQAFAGTGGGNSPMVQHSTAVRRLTPTECERLQGFPDGYSAIPWKKKSADQCPDGPRYKALGNSMAVPVMRWIGERIDKVNKEQS